MADDLDDFLKQAAQRRQQRQQQRSNRPPVVQPEPQPVRQTPTPRLQQQDPVPEAPVVEYLKPYEPTVGNLSTSLPSANRRNDMGQTDQRLQAQVQQALQQEISSIRQSENKPKKKQKKEQQLQQLQETPATAAEPQSTAKVSSVSLAAQLRDPQSLRMAIIAHEIMKRPWQ